MAELTPKTMPDMRVLAAEADAWGLQDVGGGEEEREGCARGALPQLAEGGGVSGAERLDGRCIRCWWKAVCRGAAGGKEITVPASSRMCLTSSLASKGLAISGASSFMVACTAFEHR